MKVRPLGEFVFDETRFGYSGIMEISQRDKDTVFGCALEPIISGNIDQPEYNFCFGERLSASLNVILELLGWFGTKTHSEQQQLMLLSIVSLPKMHGGEIDVWLSRRTRTWLETKLNQGQLDQIKRSMVAAHKTLSPASYAQDEKLGSYEIRVRNDQGRISLDVSGNATGVYVPGHKRFPDDGGIELESHNVDSPIQQLTLLSGLATLHQLMREADI